MSDTRAQIRLLPELAAELGADSQEAAESELTPRATTSMNIERKCPACGQGLGLVRRVSTVPGQRDIVVLVMVCGSCSHEWSAERPSSGIAVRQAEAQ